MFFISFNALTQLVLKNNKIVEPVKGKIQGISPDIPHHEVSIGSIPRYVAIFIKSEYFEQQFEKYSTNMPTFIGQYYEPSNILLSHIKEFIIEAENGLPGHHEVLKASSMQICHSIIRSILIQRPKDTAISNRIEVIKVIEFIHDNIERKITANDMAKQVNISLTHLARIFKKETGLTPNEYLLKTRLAKAKKLLLSREDTITEIAMKCGFGSSSYLSDRFFYAYKITPSEYRNNLEKG
jgi:AraC-like DNA-binding protein